MFAKFFEKIFQGKKRQKKDKRKNFCFKKLETLEIY